jgi:hypothetical protein
VCVWGVGGRRGAGNPLVWVEAEGVARGAPVSTPRRIGELPVEDFLSSSGSAPRLAVACSSSGTGARGLWTVAGQSAHYS